MTEAVLALPPPYLWLECSLHVNPGKSIGSAVLGPRTAEKVDLSRLLRAGEKVKGQRLSRKKWYLASDPVERCWPPQLVEKSDSA